MTSSSSSDFEFIDTDYESLQVHCSNFYCVYMEDETCSDSSCYGCSRHLCTYCSNFFNCPES